MSNIINYMALIGEYFPETQAHTLGDTSIYSNIIWTTTQVPQIDLDAAYLGQLKKEKIIGFSLLAGGEISSGFISSALGETHLYDSSLEDQINLIGAVATESTMNFPCRPSIQGSQTIELTGNKADSGATGLLNDATVYTASIMVDGVATDISVVGSACQLFGELRTAIQSELNVGTNYAIIGWDNADGTTGNLIITSGMYSASSTIVITDTNLFTTLTSFKNLLAPVPGTNALATSMKVYKSHTNAQLIVVINSGKDVKLALLEKFTMKQAEVMAAIDEAEIAAVTWV